MFVVTNQMHFYLFIYLFITCETYCNRRRSRPKEVQKFAIALRASSSSQEFTLMWSSMVAALAVLSAWPVGREKRSEQHQRVGRIIGSSSEWA